MAEPGIALSPRGRIAGYAGEALAMALNGLTAAGFEVTLSDRNETAMPDEPLVWRQAFSIGPDAVFWLIAGKNLWEAVGQMILGGAGIDTATDEDCRSTWLEVAGQTMSGLAGAMTADLAGETRNQGREVLATDGAQDAEVPGETPDAILEVRNSVEIWYVRIAWTSQFGQACTIPAPQALQPMGALSREGVTSKTLDLLLDVALPVSVSFGKTSLQIREVLKLNTGSVVELDRLVSEPVDVIVNNCVIARGEVVVVDGNYGVRVIHLASRADRLRSGMSEASSRLGGGAR
jgi:flagellar motor switch protein FliN/FliY